MVKTVKTALLGCSLLASGAAQAADTYEWGNVAFEGGGFVSAVIPSHTQPGLVYARTDVGGAYRWDSTAGRWIPLMDQISQLDVGLYGTEALALDPQDPARLYILGGTSYFSDGKTMIFRSSDYGESFDTVNVTSLFKAHGNGMGRQTGEKLAVDPQNGAILFCGSRTAGLFRSADSGKTWTAVSGTSSLAGSSLVNDIGIAFVVFDPTSGLTEDGVTKTLYLGVGSTSGSLYRSDDGGETFEVVSGAPAKMAMRAALSDGNLFITFSSSAGPHSVTSGAIWKYATASGTWTNVTPQDDDGNYYADGSQARSGGFGGISVDPTDPDHLVASSLCYYGGQWRTAASQEGWGDKIFTSHDGGASWTSLVDYADNDGTTPNLEVNGNAWIGGNAIHWAGSIEFDPFAPEKVWITSGNGVFRTDDIDADLVSFAFQSKGIEETVPLDIVSEPGWPLVTAIGDYDGSVYNDIATSYPRHDPAIGTTQSLGYAALNGSFLRTGQVTDYSSGTGITTTVMYLSRDTARTWTKLPTPKATHGLVVLNADGSVMLHRGENMNTVYRSVDEGETWSEVSGLDGQAQYARIVADPVDPAVFYVLDQQGYLKKSVDSGATFATAGRVSNDQNSLYQASNGLIRTVPGHTGHLWLPLDQAQSWVSGGYSSNGLAFSEDGGATFVRFAAVNRCLAIGLGKAAPDSDYPALYLWGSANGGSIGIYRSIDRGETWTRINDDAHQYGGPGNGAFVVGDFNTYGRVYMSTVGRGLVYGQIAGTSGLSESGTSEPQAARRIVAVGDRLRVVVGSSSRLVFADLSGRVLRSLDLEAGTHDIALSNLPRGAVAVRLASAGKTLESRLVVRP